MLLRYLVLPIIIVFCFATNGHCQSALRPDLKDTSQVLKQVQVLPEFDNGLAGWAKFLQSNLNTRVINKVARRDKHVRKHGLNERVMLRFVVCEDGGICNIYVANKDSVHEELATEAIRVIKLSPAWKPGVQDGKKVKVIFTQPITFKLD